MIQEYRQASAIPKVEIDAITPTMVRAALRVLNNSGIPEYPTDSDYYTVEEMLKAALTPPHREGDGN